MSTINLITGHGSIEGPNQQMASVDLGLGRSVRCGVRAGEGVFTRAVRVSPFWAPVTRGRPAACTAPPSVG